MPATLPRRAMLGAELPADAEAFTPDGMWLDGVVPGSMAERAGLVAGDCIRTIAELPVRTLAELAAALRQAGSAATTQITFARGAEVLVRDVDVTTLPHEHYDDIRVDYGELAVDGARLRTIATHGDRNATGRESPRGVIAIVQGIA